MRLGGGTGDIGDAKLGPLARSRSEECARYHTQFSGAPPEVFDAVLSLAASTLAPARWKKLQAALSAATELATEQA